MINKLVNESYDKWGGITPLQITTMSEDPEDVDFNIISDHNSDFIMMKEMGLDVAIKSGIEELNAHLIENEGFPSDFKIELDDKEIFDIVRGAFE